MTRLIIVFLVFGLGLWFWSLELWFVRTLNVQGQSQKAKNKVQGSNDKKLRPEAQSHIPVCSHCASSPINFSLYPDKFSYANGVRKSQARVPTLGIRVRSGSNTPKVLANTFGVNLIG
jgi:hypothetical protein